MDSERWKQVDHILQSALARPPQEREAVLRQECAGDEALEREVRALLASEETDTPQSDTPQSAGYLNGRVISHYRVVEKLGEGGMGVVWKARDTRLDRFVALKFLPAARMSDPARKRRFVQEAKTASALNHPNIITIYDIEQADGADFMAMEFVPGKALDRLIPRKGLPLNQALKYAIQVADALAAAHGAGIVHRDLKPGNIMVNESGCVKVVDFGLAKLVEQGVTSESAPTRTIAEAPKSRMGKIAGTVSYMSPEQAEGKKVDARTDIFSFGVVLCEMITGRRVFTGDCMASVLSAVLRDEPAVEIARGLPCEVGRIVTRCLQKDPNRRYQHAGDLSIDLQHAEEELAAGGSVVREKMPGRLSVRRWWRLGAAAACVAISFAVGWQLHEPEAALPAGRLTRLTADAGLSGFPALSPDGKLVAYSSDRSLDGEQDLYIKQVAGGQPIRLTFDGAGNTTPDFSPDGARIVFRSNRDGGGIYEIPAFGGDVRLVARGSGLNPKYSPDGTQVAYWVGGWTVAPAVPGSGTVWVVPVAGGQPQQVAPNFTAARFPIWTADGKRLLLIGYTSQKAYESSSQDWWMVSINGGEAVRTGTYDALVNAGLRARDSALAGPGPGCWGPNGNTVVFSTGNGDTQNLWEIGISPRTGKVSGAPRRLTTGAGNEVDVSCTSGGALAFTNVENRSDVWALRFDLDRGTSRGALERVTTGPAWREHASLAENGRYIAFASDQSGRRNIWVRDLATGKESQVASSSFVQRYPVSNASGSKITYSVYENNKRVVYVSAPGGTPEKLCEGCLRATDWSRDEETLLMFGGSPYQISTLDLASHQQTTILKHPNYNLLYARFSPDNRWVSFTVRTQPSRARITLAPLGGPKPIPESAWITVAEVGTSDWAYWSPDGRTLYFTSARDGHSCLWGQHIDASSRRPAGEVFAVRHLHGRVYYQERGWSARGGRIAMVLNESTGNIWTMSRSGTR